MFNALNNLWNRSSNLPSTSLETPVIETTPRQTPTSPPPSPVVSPARSFANIRHNNPPSWRVETDYQGRPNSTIPNRNPYEVINIGNLLFGERIVDIRVTMEGHQYYQVATTENGSRFRIDERGGITALEPARHNHFDRYEVERDIRRREDEAFQRSMVQEIARNTRDTTDPTGPAIPITRVTTTMAEQPGPGHVLTGNGIGGYEWVSTGGTIIEGSTIGATTSGASTTYGSSHAAGMITAISELAELEVNVTKVGNFLTFKVELKNKVTGHAYLSAVEEIDLDLDAKDEE